MFISRIRKVALHNYYLRYTIIYLHDTNHSTYIPLHKVLLHNYYLRYNNYLRYKSFYISTGDLTVTDNVIDGGAPEPGFDSAGNGIAVGLTPGALDIERNTVTCTNPQADGIAVEGLLPQDAVDPTVPVEAPRATVVRNNTVTMHGSTLGALSVYGEITRAQVDGNRVLGDAAYAMQVSPIYGDEVSYGSTFLRNNINRLHVPAGRTSTSAASPWPIPSSGRSGPSSTRASSTGSTPITARFTSVRFARHPGCSNRRAPPSAEDQPGAAVR